MELTLHRTTYDRVSTEGSLLVDGVLRCFTLELPFTDGLHGSAISEGRFAVRLLPSPKFLGSTDDWVKQYANAMPHLLGVPNRSYIMIHWGNTADNTDGCILTGESQGQDFIGSSRKAFSALYDLLRAPALVGNCWITVMRDKPLGADSKAA